MEVTKAALNLQAQFDMEYEPNKRIEKYITKEQLVDADVLTEEMSELLKILIKGGSNLICGGPCGSGKTTLIEALLKPCISMSNSQLVPITQENTISRLGPKDVLVGEVRGIEAKTVIDAMEAGHRAIFTVHAWNSRDVYNRLMTNYLMAMPSVDIKKTERIIGSSLDFICIQEYVPQIGRKLTSLDEVIFDIERQCIEINPIYRFDPIKNEFDLVNKISNEKSEALKRRGITSKELEKWVETSQENN